jgi:hypothetical protein
MKRGMMLLALMVLPVVAASSGLAVHAAFAADIPVQKKQAKENPVDETSRQTLSKETDYDRHIKADPFYPQIVAAAQTLKGRELVDFLDLAIQEDPQRMEPIAYWLRDNSFLTHDPKKVNALYFMAYADVLFWRAQFYGKAGDTLSQRTFLKESLQSLYAFEALASADALRCTDKTVLESVRNNILLSRFNRVISAYAVFSEKDITAMGKIALLIEERFADRPKNDDICGMGAAKVLDISRQPGVKKKFVDDPGAGGQMRTMLVPPPGYVYHPEYISDDEWAKQRKKSDDFLDSDWLRRYVVLKDAAMKQAAAEGLSKEQKAALQKR